MKYEDQVFSGQVCQGDVMMLPAKRTDLKGLCETKPVVALGEVTGHAHAFREPGVKGFYKAGAEDHTMAGGTALAQFVEIVAYASPMTHEEHRTVRQAAGVWEYRPQMEYAPEAIRNVAD